MIYCPFDKYNKYSVGFNVFDNISYRWQLYSYDQRNELNRWSCNLSCFPSLALGI